MCDSSGRKDKCTEQIKVHRISQTKLWMSLQLKLYIIQLWANDMLSSTLRDPRSDQFHNNNLDPPSDNCITSELTRVINDTKRIRLEEVWLGRDFSSLELRRKVTDGPIKRSESDHGFKKNCNMSQKPRSVSQVTSRFKRQFHSK